MEITINKAGDKADLTISGTLSVENAATLHQTLRELNETVTDVSIDMAEVEGADIACIQLLCSAHRSAVRRGSSFVLHGCSGGFAHSLELHGCQRHVACGRSKDGTCLWLHDESTN